MSIELDTSCEVTNPMGEITLPSCDTCMSKKVCKYCNTYAKVAASIGNVLKNEFVDDTPPGKITIACHEYRAAITKPTVNPEVQAVLLNYDSSDAKSSSDEKSVIENHPIMNDDTDGDRIRKKNEKALDSLEYLANQLDNIESSEPEPASKSISLAEKNYVPVDLFGRKIDYKEALDLVKRGVLLDRSPDPDHPIFVVK